MFEKEKSYIMIPVYDETIHLDSKDISGSQLLAQYSEDVLIRALNNGEPLIYKGNEYYLDEKIA